MASIDVDTVIRGLNSKNKVEDYAKQEQGLFQKLATAGLTGASMDAYGAAIKDLQGLNGALRTDESAAGTALSQGEKLDLGAAVTAVGDLGTKALRDGLSSDSISLAPKNGEAKPAATQSEVRKVDNAIAEAAQPGSGTTGGTTLADVEKSGQILSRGSEGAGVADAQGLLNQIKDANGKPKYDLGGYGDKKDGVDGKLGAKTTASIEQFKKDQGLTTDGKGTLDAATLERLRAVSGMSTLDGAYAPDGGKASTAANAANCPAPAAGSPGASTTTKVEPANPDAVTANRSDGPIKFEDGKLSVQGSSANEDIAMRRIGDNIRVDYARKDGEKVLERHSMEVAANKVKSATIDGGGGLDRVWNGENRSTGVDGASIRVGSRDAITSVVNHGNNVAIDGQASARSLVDNFGDNARIKGSAKAWVANSGKDSQIAVGLGGKIDNTGDNAFLTGRGFNEFNSVSPRVAIDARNGLPDGGTVVADSMASRYDVGQDEQGAVLIRAEDLPTSDLRRLEKSIAPRAVPIPDALKK